MNLESTVLKKFHKKMVRESLSPPQKLDLLSSKQSFLTCVPFSFALHC